MAGLLEKEGFETRSFDQAADVYVINTCSVTENADRECRHLVRRITRKSPASMVVITGCYAQLKPDEVSAIPGVDLVLGAAAKFSIHEHLRDLTRQPKARSVSCETAGLTTFHESVSAGSRTRAFLKVQDGCDYNCSFCTIPQARGASRSSTISRVLENVHTLAENGIREVVLTGINLGDFGRHPAQSEQRLERFVDLVRELDKCSEIERFRISSIEPNLLSPEIIQLVAASKRFMPHFHIPLQSGSNRILAAMRRRYRRELYAERVAEIRSLMPHCAIGADVIVGFPGESEADFGETQRFLDALDISYLHVFTYSERDNTHALQLGPVVPINVRNLRNRQLRRLSHQKSAAFADRHRGQSRKVLFESQRENGMMDGYTDNYIKVTVPFRAEWHNSIIDWTL